MATRYVVSNCSTTMLNVMKYLFLDSVGVPVSPHTCRRPFFRNDPRPNQHLVISRALASFIQYVGLIKAEFFDKDENNDTVFQAKFKELLQQYASITKWSYIGTKVCLPIFLQKEAIK